MNLASLYVAECSADQIICAVYIRIIGIFETIFHVTEFLFPRQIPI